MSLWQLRKEPGDSAPSSHHPESSLIFKISLVTSKAGSANVAYKSAWLPGEASVSQPRAQQGPALAPAWVSARGPGESRDPRL